MFEGNILNQGGDGLLQKQAAAELRPLEWAELAVRLEVSHDFRRLLRGAAERAEGSFDFGCAKHLAAFGEEQRGINPIALANGKMAEDKGVGVTHDEPTGDRGR